MGAVIGVVAMVIALIGLVATLGNVGYLGMLSNAAKRRGAAGGDTLAYVNGQWKAAAGFTFAAMIGLLLTTGGVVPDVIGLLVAGGAGLAAKKALDGTRAQFPGNG